MYLKVDSLYFQYDETPIFKNFQLSCENGSHIWLRGGSGSGKSTFLRLIAGLLSPERGQIRWNSHLISKMISKERDHFRRQYIAYGDQELHLAGSWTVNQNLSLVCRDPQRIIQILSDLKLSKLSTHRTSTLSGGEKQKVLLARMVLQKSQIILLDEPTAHLDDKNTELVMSVMAQHFKEKTSILVSHDSRIGQWIKEEIILSSELT
jgi:putative ABC transport system ATP-binding protein